MRTAGARISPSLGVVWLAGEKIQMQKIIWFVPQTHLCAHVSGKNTCPQFSEGMMTEWMNQSQGYCTSNRHETLRVKKRLKQYELTKNRPWALPKIPSVAFLRAVRLVVFDCQLPLTPWQDDNGFRVPERKSREQIITTQYTLRWYLAWNNCFSAIVHDKAEMSNHIWFRGIMEKVVFFGQKLPNWKSFRSQPRQNDGILSYKTFGVLTLFSGGFVMTFSTNTPRFGMWRIFWIWAKKAKKWATKSNHRDFTRWNEKQSDFFFFFWQRVCEGMKNHHEKKNEL